MNAQEIKIIKNNIKQQLVTKTTAPLLISGGPGTAKSATMRIIAESLNMQLLPVSCPSLTVEALSGLPEEYRAPQFDKYNSISVDSYGTKWSVAELIANANTLAESGPTLLVLDDFHMVQPHLQAYFFKLLLERAIGNFSLDPNVVIVGTMNDSEEAGMQQINSAVRNRLAILPIEFDFDYWFDNFGKKLNYLVASFLKTKPHFVREEESTGIEGYATARAWTSIASELDGLSREDVYKLAPKIASMQVSKDAARNFEKHIAYVNTVNFYDVVEKRKQIDISSLDPIEEIIHSYIPNFIHTVSDGIYLMELMSDNIDSTSFIGFTLAETYIKYTSSNLSDGMLFVIETLLGKEFDKEKYSTITDKEVKAAENMQISNINAIMAIAPTYIL